MNAPLEVCQLQTSPSAAAAWRVGPAGSVSSRTVRVGSNLGQAPVEINAAKSASIQSPTNITPGKAARVLVDVHIFCTADLSEITRFQVPIDLLDRHCGGDVTQRAWRTANDGMETTV